MRATTLRWFATGLVMTLFLATRASAQQPAADPPSQIDALAAKIEALDQQIRILQRRLEIEKEQASEKAKVTPTVTAGKEGYSLRSAEGDFQVKFRGYIQADGRFVGDNDTTSGPTTFALRRVRPVLEATAFRIFDFKLMPDFGQGQAVLYDAYADARFAPWLKLRIGKYKPQFGLERLQSATELTFVERGAPTNIAPNRDLGASLYGDLAGERLSYAIGVFNGVVDGGNADLDDKSGKDVLARVFALPFANASSDALKGLGAGFAVTSGSQHGTITAPDLPTYKTAAQQTHFRYRSDGTIEGTTVADGAHWRIGPQGYYYVGPVGFLSEYYVSSQRVRRNTDSDDVQTRAWQISGVYALTGEKESYRGITPRQNFDRSKGTWGGLELTARYGELQVDDNAVPVFANPATAASQTHDSVVGVNWYLNRFVKVTGQFENITFRGGAPDGGDRPTERGVYTRLQFAF
jgi:phosphate-selective porin OprO and OprP